VITGDPINIPIDTPLRLVTTVANLTENGKITIVLVSILLEVTTGLGLAHLNQTCAHLMINITTSTSAKATRNNPTRMTIVQETIEILSVLNHIHIHNIKDEINTEDANRANLIATHRLLEISTVIKDRPATMSVIRDSLVVKNARTDLIVVRQDPLHRIHPGRAVRKGNRTIIQKDRMDIHGLSQSRSYSKVTTSILTAATLLNLLHMKTKWIHIHRIDQRNVMLHAYPMAEF